MNKVLIFLCLFINSIFAGSNFVVGYGVSSYDVPIVNYGNISTHNIYSGVEQSFIINSKDQIVLLTLLSTNRRFNVSYLSEFELQMGFKKKLTTNDSVAFGFHVSHLLSEHIPEVDLIGSGFGLNMAFTHHYSNQFSFNIQIHTTSYGVTSSSTGFDRFTNQTIRTFIHFLP